MEDKQIWFFLAKRLSLENWTLSLAIYAVSFAIFTITLTIVAWQLTLRITITFIPTKQRSPKSPIVVLVGEDLEVEEKEGTEDKGEQEPINEDLDTSKKRKTTSESRVLRWVYVAYEVCYTYFEFDCSRWVVSYW
ncbi:uncharacterized protein LOC112005988 isoform X2 [Quercus suber]|uniref:uncharacterized protein LOC112005988 isoform X2 n=1 Tax=Quercus suber TaxID=58331 RepID=UPI000CE255FD|nr:uncharacterized protein LOC112005988 isoform X2 [Quercus suber]